MANETDQSELLIQQLLAVRLQWEDFEKAAVLIYPDDPIAAVALIIRLQALKRVLADTQPEWAATER